MLWLSLPRGQMPLRENEIERLNPRTRTLVSMNPNQRIQSLLLTLHTYRKGHCGVGGHKDIDDSSSPQDAGIEPGKRQQYQQ